MFVGSSHKVGGDLSIQTCKSRKGITRGGFVGMSHVSRSVGVIDGRGQVKVSWTFFCRHSEAARLGKVAVFNGRLVLEGPAVVRPFGAWSTVVVGR